MRVIFLLLYTFYLDCYNKVLLITGAGHPASIKTSHWGDYNLQEVDIKTNHDSTTRDIVVFFRFYHWGGVMIAFIPWQVAQYLQTHERSLP